MTKKKKDCMHFLGHETSEIKSSYDIQPLYQVPPTAQAVNFSVYQLPSSLDYFWLSRERVVELIQGFVFVIKKKIQLFDYN